MAEDKDSKKINTIEEQRQTIAEQRQTIAEQKEKIDIGKKKVIEISEVIQRTSILLSRAIELRDPYTKGHSEHVGEMAVNFVTLNHLLNFPKEKIPVIYRAGLLHDVGKIGITEQVLNKPTKLTEAEFIMIKYHTNLGYSFFKTSSIDIFLLIDILMMPFNVSFLGNLFSLAKKPNILQHLWMASSASPSSKIENESGKPITFAYRFNIL